LWPFQEDLTPAIEKVKHKSFRPFMPEQIDGSVLQVIAVAGLAICLVFVAHRLAARK
jgi:hypothetical protein